MIKTEAKNPHVAVTLMIKNMPLINLIWLWARFVCTALYNVVLQLKGLVPCQVWLPISSVTEKSLVQSKMIKAIEIESQTKSFRRHQGWENKTSAEYRTQKTNDQNSQLFLEAGKFNFLVYNMAEKKVTDIVY